MSEASWKTSALAAPARPESVADSAKAISARRLAVQAVPANDPAAIEHASREYMRKYGPGPYATAMVQPEILSTTLRLDPR